MQENLFEKIALVTGATKICWLHRVGFHQSHINDKRGWSVVRSMVARFLFRSLLILLPLSTTWAQVAIRSQALSSDSLRNRNSAAVSFDQAFNSYHWNGHVLYQILTGPLTLSINERFLSNIVRTNQAFISDQQTMNFFLKNRMSSQVQNVLKLSSFFLSDDRSINLTKISTHTLYGGIEYHPTSLFMVEPLVGLRFDEQVGHRDKGMSYVLSMTADSADYNGYLMSLGGKWQYDQLAPRRLETRHADFFVYKMFFEKTQNSFQFLYDRTRRDMYVPADLLTQKQYGVTHNIESRTENSFGVADTLEYWLSDRATVSIQGMVASREIGRELLLRNNADAVNSVLGTTIDELRLESVVQLRYRPWDSAATSIRFEYSERDERHTVELSDQLHVQSSNDPIRAEERKNNHSRRTSLASNLSIGLSRSHGLSFSGSANLLRYDTPNIENDDDRDELWYFLGLNSVHRFGQYLTAAVAAELSMIHVVYLGSGRSANNTWNRIIRFSPKLIYRTSKDFLTVNTFEVLGNYTAYDFEFPSSDIRSFAYRHFSFVDSSVLALTNRLMFSWLGQLKFYEQGELSWSKFSERPISYFEDRMFAGMLSYGIGRGLHFTVGIRFFSQSHYGYQGSEKQLDRVLRSTGPISELVYEPGARMLLSIKGWYETQSQTGQPHRHFTTLTMTFIVNI